ncbi:Hpt domain-containing protein [Thioalbus denitrificans]|uniref:Chemotaxis protein CheA n=1 Tax=Thioalbus denitrificans TaxID=547122 RepID=A0A369C9E0_9GAMM|nr:Hpt domain-containing protein [Thioalbus denitrificans]RCX30343.1 chemosensory pili system protein ChpA (sensor histidine kinase/response regulator) [Thioalbus denitrificans]
MNDTTALSLIRAEIDQALEQVRRFLERYIEHPEESAVLEQAADELHRILGSLRMVELYGAALVAEEMERVARDLLEDRVPNRDDACGVLVQAAMQLPNYLERIQAGESDNPLVLLPLLNDLRSGRGAELLSDTLLFEPDLSVMPPAGFDADSLALLEGDLRKPARSARHLYQLGLLGLLRNQQLRQALGRLRLALSQLEKISSGRPMGQLWWVASGVVAAVAGEGLEAGLAVKHLLSRLDRHIRRVAEEGESALEETPPAELVKNLLYYNAKAEPVDARVRELKSAFRLDAVLPSEADMARRRKGLSAANRGVLRVAIGALKEELSRAKDQLDLFVRSEPRELSDLESLRALLRRVADTLVMLGMGHARGMIQQQAAVLEAMERGERPVEDSVLMEVAGALLYVESGLDLLQETGQLPGQDEARLTGRESAERSALRSVLHESLLTIQSAKQDFAAALAEPGAAFDGAAMAMAVEPVLGALRMLEDDAVAGLLAAWLERIRPLSALPSESAAYESLADALTAVESYLDALQQGRRAEGYLEIGRQRLGLPQPATAAAAASPAAQGPAEWQIAAGESLEEAIDESIEIGGLVYDWAISPGGHPGPEPADQEHGHEAGPEPVGEAIDVFAPGSEEPAAADVSDAGEPVPAAAAGGREPGGSAEADAAHETGAEEAEPPDPELVEIFIEEADEVLASIDENLARWKSDPDDTEARQSVRRAYHTLKGSGRMVGAMEAGELAWAVENLLNRVIDGTLPAAPAVFDAVDESRRLLPSLLDAFAGNRACPEGAEARELGESCHLLSAATLPAAAGPSVEAEPGPEPGPEPEPEPEPAEPLATEAPPAVEAGAGMDPVLLGIFSAETRGHLAVVEEFLERCRAQGDGCRVDGDLQRALHTLHGSAGAARVEPMSDLAGRLESLVKVQAGLDSTPAPAFLDLLEEGLAVISGQFEALLSAPAAVPAAAELCARIGAEESRLHAAVPPMAAGSAADEAGLSTPGAPAVEEPAGSAPVTGTAAGAPGEVLSEWELALDAELAEADVPAAPPELDELTELFLDEGAAMLQSADALLRDWLAEPGAIQRLEELRFQLHSLAEGARLAGCMEVGAFAGQLEQTYADLAAGRLPRDYALSDWLQSAHDGLAGMLDSIQTGEPVEETGPLLEQLQALRTRPQAPAGEEEAAGIAEAAEEPPATIYPEPAPEAVVEPGPEPEPEPEPATVREPVSGYAAIDPDLLDIFREEAAELLDAIERALQGWARAPAEPGVAEGLRRALHTLKGGARTTGLQEMADLSHQMESLIDAVRDGTLVADDRVVQLLHEGYDGLASMLEQVAARLTLSPAEALLLRMREALSSGPGPLPSELTAPAAAPAEPVAAPGPVPAAPAPQQQEMVRVRAELLDRLGNVAGEVSISRSRLGQQVSQFGYHLQEFEETVNRLRGQLRRLEIETEAQILFRYEQADQAGYDEFDPLELDRFSHMQQLSRALMESAGDLIDLKDTLAELNRDSETLLLQQSRINTELQEGLMRARMVPFSSLVPRLRRIVRQITGELGKRAELRVLGGEGEMDRSVLNRMVGPLEHLLRNAIDHGIEPPAVRQAAGKADVGTITLDVRREGGEVVLVLSDDGGGVNLDAVRATAISRGLLGEGERVGDYELMQLILESGFSTAENVTQISGRGVGLDVVNSEIKQLGGMVSIESTRGEGAAFCIRLPFTLSVNQALMVYVGEELYAIPLTSIEGIIRLDAADVVRHHGAQGVPFRYAGQDYRLEYLGSLLGLHREAPVTGGAPLPVLLVRGGDSHYALLVDGIQGSGEIVVKSLGAQLSTVRGIAGATILGDGRVVVILDMPALIRTGAVVQHTVEAAKEVHTDEARPPRVLVVDDSITVRKVTTRLLGRNGMEVLTAKDGVDAMALLLELEHLPDIMLLDIEMPRMDGYELASLVRHNERLREVPIVMITSRTGEKHRERAEGLGVSRYLGKPYQEKDLLETIRELTGQEE